MKCPKCRGSLVADDTAEISQSLCGTCGALWLQRSALEAMLRHEAAQRGTELANLALVEGAPRPTGFNCPTGDGHVLDVVTLRGVPVESCASCGGLLLDPSEPDVILERVLSAAKAWAPAYQEMMHLVTKRNTAEINRIRTII